jgi:HAD superfamily phosphatase (TIGR01668 family)
LFYNESMLKAKFKPDAQLNSIFDLSLAQLNQDGVQTLLVDVNNTLISPEERVLSSSVLKHLTQLQNQGLQIILVSNNRNRPLKQQLDLLDLKYIEHALKPIRFRISAYLKLWKVSPAHLGVLGDQIFTDVYLGKRMQARTYWVKPLSTKDHMSTRWLRHLEAWVLR